MSLEEEIYLIESSQDVMPSLRVVPTLVMGTVISLAQSMSTAWAHDNTVVVGTEHPPAATAIALHERMARFAMAHRLHTSLSPSTPP